MPLAAKQGFKAAVKWEARKDELLPYAEKATQSEADRFFEMLADLTDDDGAIAEFDDLLGFLG